MKAAKQNLILMIIPALLFLLLGIALFALGTMLSNTFQAAIPQTPTGDVGDAEGYAFIFSFFGAGFGWITGFAIQLVGFIAIAYAFIVLIFTVIARVIYKPRPGRILAYRILTGIDLFIFLSPVPYFARSFITSIVNGDFSPGSLIYLFIVLAVSVVVIINTYTYRIQGQLENPQ